MSRRSASPDVEGGRGAVELGEPRDVLRVTFGCEPEAVAENVVLTPFLPLKSFARHVADGTLKELAPTFFYKGFSARFGATPVTVILTGVGPSRVGDCVSLLSLTPARRLLFAGAVGGLRPEYGIGDFFLPFCAADGEGYSRYQRAPFDEIARAAPSVLCAGGLEEGLRDFLRSRGVAVWQGRAFTVGAFAAESRQNLETLARLGYDALEMELSAFYTAAERHAFAAGALTYVSDLPLRSSLWQPKTAGEQSALRAAYRALPLYALEFLSGSGA